MDTIQQLREIRCGLVDGVMYYRLNDIFDALGLPEKRYARDRASSLIGAEHKRFIWQQRRTRSGKVYRDKRFCYIDRIGAERLFIRYGGMIQRSVLLEALPMAP